MGLFGVPRHRSPGLGSLAFLGIMLLTLMAACESQVEEVVPTTHPEPAKAVTEEPSPTGSVTALPTVTSEPAPVGEGTTTSTMPPGGTESVSTLATDAPSDDASVTLDGAPPATVEEAEPLPEDSSTPPTPDTTSTILDDLSIVEIIVREGRAVSEERVKVPLGNRILLRFDSDARLLVHVHGYDEEFSVEADVLASHEFHGDLPGIFEVEDHVTHRLLIELEVSP